MSNLCLVLLYTGIFLSGSSSQGQELPYYLRAGGLFESAGGGKFFDLGPAGGLSLGAGIRMGKRWELGLAYAQFKLANNKAVPSVDTLAGFTNNIGADFVVKRTGIEFNLLALPSDNRLQLIFGAGGGLMVWEMTERSGDTALNVISDRNATTDFAATELYVGGSTGIRWLAGKRVSIDIVFQADYLTGAGAEFASPVNTARDRWLLGANLRLSLFFGSRPPTSSWSEIRNRSDNFARPLKIDPMARDSDGDGVVDRIDRCAGSAIGVTVDQFGCPLDSDRDGVYDGLDDCPQTAREAAGSVDIYGCAVDSDFDGVPDYADTCPSNPIGADVDVTGCPIDSDGDGVPDGIDDCPHTLAGMAVDKQGCIDLAVLAEPMVLNIDYVSGAFEIDPHNQQRLKRLAGLLNFVTTYKVDINGYTDNVGSASVNRQLADKRARRVRDFLVNYEVSPDRIKVFGRGETNFVASNQTSEGRARNRRIEIVFYK